MGGGEYIQRRTSGKQEGWTFVNFLALRSSGSVAAQPLALLKSDQYRSNLGIIYPHPSTVYLA
jgi:hypothetical protein